MASLSGSDGKIGSGWKPTFCSYFGSFYGGVPRGFRNGFVFASLSARSRRFTPVVGGRRRLYFIVCSRLASCSPVEVQRKGSNPTTLWNLFGDHASAFLYLNRES